MEPSEGSMDQPHREKRIGRPKGARDVGPRYRRTKFQLNFDRLVGRNAGKYEACMRPQPPCPHCQSCYNVTWVDFSRASDASASLQRSELRSSESLAADP